MHDKKCKYWVYLFIYILLSKSNGLGPMQTDVFDACPKFLFNNSGIALQSLFKCMPFSHFRRITFITLYWNLYLTFSHSDLNNETESPAGQM